MRTPYILWDVVALAIVAARVKTMEKPQRRWSWFSKFGDIDRGLSVGKIGKDDVDHGTSSLYYWQR